MTFVNKRSVFAIIRVSRSPYVIFYKFMLLSYYQLKQLYLFQNTYFLDVLVFADFLM